MTNEFSPNWLWVMLGFTICRDGLRRTIFDSHGHKVCERAMPNIEQSIAAWLYFGAVLSPQTKDSYLHKEYVKSIV